MSHAKRIDASGSVSSRTRRQTRARARDEEDETKQHTAQSSSHVSPAMRIYRHALEAIFALLSLQDLIQILAVCREWSAAVRSMKPISSPTSPDDCGSICDKNAFYLTSPIISRIVASPLLRHLAAIQISVIRREGVVGALTNESLALLTRHAPKLTSLQFALILTSNEPLLLPAKLTSLYLQLNDKYAPSGTEYTDNVINGVLTTLAALPLLSHLGLKLSAFDRQRSVDLRVLSGCRSLSDLKLETCDNCAPQLSATQVDQIRSSLGHLRHFSVGGRMKSDLLARLLQPPVAVRWRDIGYVCGDGRSAQLLRSLPTLTRLEITYEAGPADAEFLSQLPLLTVLSLDCEKYGAERDGQRAWYLPADALLASLLRCTSLTELRIRCGFRSAHWSALFAALTLKKLHLRGTELETLRCFAAGPITESLEELTVDGYALLPSELPHLYGLRLLRTLDLRRCFKPHLDGATIISLSPPTPLLPALTALFHGQRGTDDFVQRQGASFEWMQARRTQ